MNSPSFIIAFREALGKRAKYLDFSNKPTLCSVPLVLISTFSEMPTRDAQISVTRTLDDQRFLLNSGRVGSLPLPTVFILSSQTKTRPGMRSSQERNLNFKTKEKCKWNDPESVFGIGMSFVYTRRHLYDTSWQRICYSRVLPACNPRKKASTGQSYYLSQLKRRIVGRFE